MSRWFRHYAGMMRDEKLVAVAVRCKQPVERVLWVWGAILESAAEVNDGGRYDFDPLEAAYFLRSDEGDIRAIEAGLTTAGRLAEGRVVNWGNRQFESDKSVARQAAYRERKRQSNSHGDNQSSGGDVTPPSRDAQVTPQEAESEADTDTEKLAAREPEEKTAACVRIGQKITDLMGVTNDPRWVGNWSTVSVWLAQGYDEELDIMPTVVATVERFKKTGRKMPGSLKYFSNAIAENFKARQETGTSPVQPSREILTVKKGTPGHKAWMALYRKQGKRMAFFEAQDYLTVPTEYPQAEQAA